MMNVTFLGLGAMGGPMAGRILAAGFPLTIWNRTPEPAGESSPATAGLTASRFVPDPYGPPGTRMYRTGDLARFLIEIQTTPERLAPPRHRTEPKCPARVTAYNHRMAVQRIGFRSLPCSL